MAEIIQTNIDEILQLFLRSAEISSCQQVDVQDMNRAMNEEISMLDNGYNGVLLGGVITPTKEKNETNAIQ